MKFSIFATAGLVASVLSAPAENPYTVHEKRDLENKKWIPRDIEINGKTPIPMSIGLTQQNLDRGHEYLMDVSDPNSPNYGKHWSPEKVAETFAPTAETVAAVKVWLAENGISEDRTWMARGNNWIRFNSTLREAELLLKTKYKVYEHIETQKSHLACDDYSIPASLRSHVDFIIPTIHFDAIVTSPKKRQELDIRSNPIPRGLSFVNNPESPTVKEWGLTVGNLAVGNLPRSPASRRGLSFVNNPESPPVKGWGLTVGNLPRSPANPRGLSSVEVVPGSPANKGWAPKVGPQVKTPYTAKSKQPTVPAICNSYITPDCLRALYNIPNGSLSESSFGVVEYTPQAYTQSDLKSFFQQIEPRVPSGTTPSTKLIDGATIQQSEKGFDYNGESNLDLEFAIALVYPQTVTLYQVGDMVEGASFNNFLDAIDASYCKSGGGDNPVYDAIYPDVAKGGYTGKENCGTLAATSVISTSYGYNEADLSASYETRQCNEYMKLGLQGITFVFSSGDYGVAGNGGQCCTKKGCAGGSYNSGSSGSFNPSFPSTCPYVTSVGATQTVNKQFMTKPEVACETVIMSGGGFSNVFSKPSYQSSAVSTYFSKHKPSYSATLYNNNQNARGYPDISANGANYIVGLENSFYLVYGTSCSAPVVGSMITLINNARKAAKKGPVGFINPVLYANPTAFNDITSGSNPGCGTSGFSAVPGWDPVTGLGTINYPSLLEVFMKLP